MVSLMPAMHFLNDGSCQGWFEHYCYLTSMVDDAGQRMIHMGQSQMSRSNSNRYGQIQRFEGYPQYFMVNQQLWVACKIGGYACASPMVRMDPMEESTTQKPESPARGHAILNP